MQQMYGVAEVNKATEIGTIDGVYGPIGVFVEGSIGTNNVVVMFAKESDLTTPLTTDNDTAVSDEDTVYNGDGATLNFTGQSLNNVPIIPKSITVKPAAGGNTVNATDKYGDGNLYTADNDLDLCGYVDYHTGAIRLNYPAGKEPNTGDIDCDYKYSTAIVGKGTLMFKLTNVALGDRIKVYCAAQTNSVQVQIDVAGGH